MTMPDWGDARLGTMKRAGLWLVQVVGEGNTFTKAQLRTAFPDVAQIDRRMRDLRNFSWKIDTSREDASLDTHEQRFTQQGIPVWQPGKGTRPATATVTSSQRREILARDGYKCRSCGIGPGDRYDGTAVTAQLDIARRTMLLPGGRTETQLVIECNRCRVGGREMAADLRDVLARVARLPMIEKKMLAIWIDQDSRAFSEVEQIWADFRTLPLEAREELREALP
ncbi:hypothetical protein GCM10010435_84820 [Winogradskya consettensis]|uniref:HNH endonuclease n=1 Tax=Winogradskya consettensis TaxID=113560 RepID=A0A919SJE4_9ACTN|nr:hypothetical protein [Actinoplanes consettensis]GIM72694.1 hypothetical protein Aco04nite_31580 [Actinoplanes consettensis]